MNFPALIADCGSTGCDWRLLDAGNVETLPKTRGYNPTYEPAERLVQIVTDGVLPNLKAEVKTVWFYGAGCKSESAVASVVGALQGVFTAANVKVESDLLASARAVYRGEPLFCGILGTGSNSCYYDGKALTIATPSLGYILGDEGSGNHIGRLLLRAYFYKTMPEDLRKLFAEKYAPQLERVLQSVYQTKNASGYLAGYAVFAAENAAHPFVDEMVSEAMRAFLSQIKNSFPQHRDAPLGMVGSIAFYFKKQLAREAQKLGFNLAVVLQSPADRLAAYHLETP